MRKNLKAKSYLYPLPVLIIGTFNEDGTPNAMNAAWGTICDTNQVAIVLSATHKTVKNILRDKVFTVSTANSKNVTACDYVGIVSGNDVENKIAKTNWTFVKGEVVNSPIFNELPLCLECKLVSYDFDTEICIGEVVNVSAEEYVLDEKGKVDIKKLDPICYDCESHGYYVIGSKVAQAFSIGKEIL